ncbi:hypothetical protein BBO01nite_41710 [Brevibacillus borstelensis]|nr:hypothetical protein BBO01nite_41710 [Brevibacillus borstelensis]
MFAPTIAKTNETTAYINIRLALPVFLTMFMTAIVIKTRKAKIQKIASAFHIEEAPLVLKMVIFVIITIFLKEVYLLKSNGAGS